MDYLTLVAEHQAIEQAASALLRLANGNPRPEVASHLFDDLAELVRDHLAHEGVIIYETVRRIGAGRHNAAAAASLAAFEELRDDWGRYLSRWDPTHVADEWERFRMESASMLERLSERVAAETTILYSLAVHHRVLDPGPRGTAR